MILREWCGTKRALKSSLWLRRENLNLSWGDGMGMSGNSANGTGKYANGFYNDDAVRDA
jgi:hypothetical protein